MSANASPEGVAGGVLRIDTDGDLATAEMMIRFSAGTSLVETDLILA